MQSDPNADRGAAIKAICDTVGVKFHSYEWVRGRFDVINVIEGDFGGGGMLLALGVCAALNTVNKEGKGQVIDAAMTEGSALLMSMMYGMLNSGIWTDSRDSNLLDGAAHF